MSEALRDFLVTFLLIGKILATPFVIYFLVKLHRQKDR